jgi:UDP-N-acetylmuramoyl-L-alanyl-D-glutamate--2,6-diaminopimelate ligase
MTEHGLSLGVDELLRGLSVSEQIPEVWIGGLALDARRVVRGDAFVALAGRQAHGMDFLAQAVDAGAVAVIHDGVRQLPTDCPLPAVSVPGLKERLPDLARRMWGELDDMDLIAVTGTNGKSSIAWLLAQALDGAMVGTLGVGRPGRQDPGTLTTPDVLSVYRSLNRLRASGVARVVLEASSHALDQNRLAGLRFTSVIFTTLGHDHLDYHGDMQAYGQAKARLFRDFVSRRQIINLDDPFGRNLARELQDSAGRWTYGVQSGDPVDVRGRLLTADRKGLKAELTLRGQTVIVQSQLLGRVNLYNLLVVAAELSARGVDLDGIQETLARLEPVPGRMQPVTGANGRTVVIDYAHTPDALENVLTSLRELKPAQLWCVFGCGGDRDQAKRPRMGRIAESLADQVILTDDNPRHESSLSIIRAIQAGMRHPQRCHVIPDRATAIGKALNLAGDDDLILVAGKGHETEQIVGDQRHEFSDEAVVRQILEEAA